MAIAPAHPAQLVEVCAQAIAAQMADSVENSSESGPVGGVLVGVRRFRIERAPEPSERLSIAARLTASLGEQMLFDCQVRGAGHDLVAAGRLAVARRVSV